MNRRAFTAILLMLAAAFGPFACKEKPTGPDLSNPRSAAVVFSKALEEGDLATAKLASNASGIEVELIEAMAQSASGIKRLNAAAHKRFGEEARKLVLQNGSVNVAKSLAEGNVDQDAVRATVRSKDGRDKVQLQKLDGKWRVDVGALTKGKDVSRVVPFFRAAGAASRKVADEIDADQYKTVEDAQQAVTAQIAGLMPQMLREQFSPSTKPAIADIPEPSKQEF